MRCGEPKRPAAEPGVKQGAPHRSNTARSRAGVQGGATWAAQPGPAEAAEDYAMGSDRRARCCGAAGPVGALVSGAAIGPEGASGRAVPSAALRDAAGGVLGPVSQALGRSHRPEAGSG